MVANEKLFLDLQSNIINYIKPPSNNCCYWFLSY